MLKKFRLSIFLFLFATIGQASAFESKITVHAYDMSKIVKPVNLPKTINSADYFRKNTSPEILGKYSESMDWAATQKFKRNLNEFEDSELQEISKHTAKIAPYEEASEQSCSKLVKSSKVKEIPALAKIDSVKKSGNNKIDALIYGQRFNETNIRYRFDDETTPQYFKQSVRKAFRAWESVSPLRFYEMSGIARCSQFAHITIIRQDVNKSSKYSVLSSGDGGGYASDNMISTSKGRYSATKTIHIDDSYKEENLETGSHGYEVALHEIGHIIGLKHPGKYNSYDEGPFLSKEEDNSSKTVMSYHSKHSDYGLKPRQYDIQAINYLYNAKAEN